MAIKNAIPTFQADSDAVALPSRTGSYGEAYVLALGAGKQTLFAGEGSYFTAYNVTDGTGIAGHAAPVQADLSLKPLLHVFNGSATKSLYPDFLRIRFTAIGAGASTTDFTTWVDNNGATVKTSGGTVATQVCSKGGGTADASSVISFGAVVATAAATEVRVDHQQVRPVVAVVQDQYVFQFGGSGSATPAATVLTGTNVLSAFCLLAPICVPPKGNFKFSQWGASQSGAHSFEYTFGYVLR
jgi:hypothetical protein